MIVRIQGSARAKQGLGLAMGTKKYEKSLDFHHFVNDSRFVFWFEQHYTLCLRLYARVHKLISP